MDIKKRVDELYDEIVSIRRHMHMYPELSEYEVETQKYISNILTQYNIEHTTGVASNGIVAIINGRVNTKSESKSKVVGIRADIDALPVTEKVETPFKSKNYGIMHACGHDLHTSILLGTARVLKEMENEFSGSVKLFFQPAEETIGGANRMIEWGCLNDPKVDNVIALHVAPEIPVGAVEFCYGKMNAASTELYIDIVGHSCHGAHPDKGFDAIVVASNVVCALQSITSRNLSPTNPGIVTIGQFHAGSKNNIIAGDVKLGGIIRALDNQTREYIKNRVKVLTENIATGYKCIADVRFIDSYPALINDDNTTMVVVKVAEEVVGVNNIYYMAEPSLGADDFSYFTQTTKSVYFNIGTKTGNEEHIPALHNEWYNPDERCIRTGMMIEILSTLKLLSE